MNGFSVGGAAFRQGGNDNRNGDINKLDEISIVMVDYNNIP